MSRLPRLGAQRGKKARSSLTNRRLRQGIEDDLRTLGTDRIGIVNLRLMRGSGPDSFFDYQLEAVMVARDDGLTRAVGLSNVSLADLLHALKFTEIAWL